METKFTKGKWYVAEDNSSDEKGNEIFIRADKGMNHPRIITCWASSTSENEANAKLISAAPEMIQMLIAINETLLSGINIHHEDTIHQNIQKLIKKATE